MERVPRRTCIGCRTTRAKSHLRRFTVTPEGVAVDPDQTRPGRGAYVCPDLECVDRLDRAGGQPLRRALRTDTTTTVAAIDDLRAQLTQQRDRLERAADGPGADTTAPGTTGVTTDATDRSPHT